MSHKRKCEENRRLKKLYEKTRHAYGAGVWFDESKGRYIKYSCHNKWLKTHCRRIIRRRMKNIGMPRKGNGYRKLFDYWWELL